MTSVHGQKEKMMRLIEANAVYKILESCEIEKATIGNPLTDWEYGYNCGIERAESEIECAPTIDAIPVEWINDWYDRYMYAEVGDLLNDWMEEVRQMKEYIVTEHPDFPYEEPKPQELIRCKDCKYYREDGDCWHEWDNDGRIYYQAVINEPNADDYCSRAVRK